MLLNNTKPNAAQARSVRSLRLNPCTKGARLGFALLLVPPLAQVRADAALSTAIMSRGEKVYRYLLAAMYLATFAWIGVDSWGCASTI